MLSCCTQGANQTLHDEGLQPSGKPTLHPQENRQPRDPAAALRQWFSYVPFRKFDSIRYVWDEYTREMDGVSFQSLDDNNEGWSNRAKWGDKPAYQAWLKWSAIVERIKVYARAIAAALRIDAQEAELKAVQVLQYEYHLANVSLSTFRQQALKKEATGNLRTQDVQSLGQQLKEKLEQLVKSGVKVGHL